ncbi:hypothetical protein JCM19275_2714 [Nonlabens ulvanivorans]|uniref:Uncharacterized protein n=1 Tax=Nonlabens ulvanivorans TaxID=906888 RepID=A0A090X1S8_NONUL|nr:hypothetical protein JCM19275_2714 [Nonlabens ulvanivorans]
MLCIRLSRKRNQPNCRIWILSCAKQNFIDYLVDCHYYLASKRSLQK